MTIPPVLVQKFGGTSVATPERRQQVVAHVRRAQDEGFRVAIVVSAMGRRGDPYATDTLLDLLRTDGGRVDPRDYSLIFVTGEIIATAVMSHTLKRAGLPAVGLSGVQAGIRTDGQPVEAELVHIDTRRLQTHLSHGEVAVVTGGQGASPDTLDYCTMGRGASDTSGVALGVALGAAKVEVFTDVPGVAVVDPRLVPDPRWLGQVSYGHMHTMARFGAKVLHPRAVLAGWRGHTPIVVRSTFDMAPGTLVDEVEDQYDVVGIPVLAPLETMILPPDSIPQATREQWERRRVIMSLVDSESGEMFLGIDADRADELTAALAEVGLSPRRRIPDQAWVSLIGDTGALRARAERDRRCLAQLGVSPACREHVDGRSTYVVPVTAKADVVRSLYESVFGQADVAEGVS
jgi:aspartate kinase